MIDMHCHILPGIDDGAQTIEESLELLAMEKEQGIKKSCLHRTLIPKDRIWKNFSMPVREALRL